MVSPLAGFLPSHVLWGLVSMGTLVAFMAVAISLMVLRHRQARAGVKPTGFRVPAYPLIPLASLAACLYLTLHLDSVVYAIFALWMALSLAAYAMYTRYGRCTALKAG
jgi:APA family basic amino acid/polyamine antiporter